MYQVNVEKIDKNLSQGQRNRLGLTVDSPENAMVRFDVVVRDNAGIRCIETIEMPFVRVTESTRNERQTSKRALRQAIRARALRAIEEAQEEDDGIDGLVGEDKIHL